MRYAPAFFSAMLLGSSLLLCSCVNWNLGPRLSEQGETRLGVDITRPVDGLIYNNRYMFAPEVEYVPRTPIISAGEKEVPSLATKVRPTGRVLVAEVELTGSNSARFVRSLGAMPAGVLGAPLMHRLQATSECFGTMVSNRTLKGKYARGASAPLTYVVDPVLSVFTTPVYWIYAGGRSLVKQEPFRWVPITFPRPETEQR